MKKWAIKKNLRYTTYIEETVAGLPYDNLVDGYVLDHAYVDRSVGANSYVTAAGDATFDRVGE